MPDAGWIGFGETGNMHFLTCYCMRFSKMYSCHYPSKWWRLFANEGRKHTVTRNRMDRRQADV